jgi:ATP-dependent exoDNAse (exonuclease V) alpha subunit
LVVDEAGMLGTRALHELIGLTAAYRTKLVMVGDPHQLPEIEAGGLFAALTATAPALHLVGNQRQREPWERAALAQLRDGDVVTAVQAYDDHGRLCVAESGRELTDRLVVDYRESRRTTGPGQTVVVTSSRADARRLNRLIRESLVDAGELGETELVVSLASGTQRAFRSGDELVVTANDYRRALLNGTRGVVSAVDARSGRVSVRLGDGRDVSLPRGYLESGRLVHGYALTCHRAQGMTVEVALVSGSVALTRESGYVAMSRGRQANALYLTHDALRHDPGGDVDRPRTETKPSTTQRAALARAALVERLEFSGRQRLALSWLRRASSSRTRPSSRRSSVYQREVC